ncbi:F-box only protein 21 isoform X2 [Chrysemys picta bellii]|uniref:F-box only protein 21 isoform X2 n=1 Tax=Chrysemys picta bellii TaxID=8478 RepID=UPI0032B2E9F5
MAAAEAGGMGLTDLPGELLELILCSGVLSAADIGRVSCTCRRLRDVCQARGKVWRERFRLRWPSLLKYYSHTDNVNWLKEYKARHNAGLETRRIVASFSKRFFSEHVPCDGFSDLETLGCPGHFFEDELMSILNMEGRKCLTWKYYAKKILYFLRQQNILKNLKAYLERPGDQLSFLEGEVLIVSDVEFQRQVLDAVNCVLYEQLKYKGNEMDYYNSLNSYIHQVLIRRTGIPISLSVLYLTIARQLGVRLEPVNFPSHFLLRWCQGKEGSTDIFDYIYIDAFGKGKQLTVKECEYLIGHHVTEEFYGVVTSKEVLQRMVGNLLNLGKRESTDQSYQLLRDSLDLYLAMYPDNVQHLMLQARLYFHLGIWPEKVLDILQHVQVLDPSQHGAVGYLVQHTLEHIERRKEEVGPEVKHHSEEKHKDICFSIGLIMKHKRYGYNCVIYGWDPTCMMGQEWMRNMNVHSLPHGPHQPFYNVLVEDGSCIYAAQENLEYNLEPHEIPHPDVGRYFSEFTGTHYLANKELEIRYPEDLELSCATVQKIYSKVKE